LFFFQGIHVSNYEVWLYIQCQRVTCPAIRANDVVIGPEKEADLIDIGEFAVGENDDSLHDFEPRRN
jgi:hypothetical protein